MTQSFPIFGNVKTITFITLRTMFFIDKTHSNHTCVKWILGFILMMSRINCEWWLKIIFFPYSWPRVLETLRPLLTLGTMFWELLLTKFTQIIPCVKWILGFILMMSRINCEWWLKIIFYSYSWPRVLETLRPLLTLGTMIWELLLTKFTRNHTMSKVDFGFYSNDV